MPAARKNIIQEVQAKVDAGFTFDRVHELIVHPPPNVGWGEYLEGQEQEPLLGEGEAAWVNDAKNMDAQAAKDLEFQLLCQEDVGEVSGDIVLQQPGDDADDSSTAVADVRGAASPAKLPWRAQGVALPQVQRSEYGKHAIPIWISVIAHKGRPLKPSSPIREDVIACFVAFGR